MRGRVLLIVSLSANIGLAMAWFVYTRNVPPSRGTVPAVHPPTTDRVRTNVVLRRQYFTWQEVESDDYPTYIANLRDIGCPEQTIRDIIIADVNALYSRKRATEVVTAEQQWWRTAPDTNILLAAVEKMRGLETDRRGLLTRLLGTNWESGDLINLPRPSRVAMTLDGPVLGVLSADVKQSIQEISLGSQEKMQAYLEAQRAAGKEPDPVELAKMRLDTRNELARVLAPQQLEEYLLRYSQNANNLRSQLGQLEHFNPSPDEFRAVFRATDQLDQQLALLGNSDDPNLAAQRRSLEQQRENAIKLALGAKRYEQYHLLHDPVYRDAYAAAAEAGTPEAAQEIYVINLAAAEEQERIRTNATLTADQKKLELKRAELDQLRAAAESLGQELPPEPPVPQPSAPKKTHVIQPGDTVGSVSFQYGVSMSALREANPGLDFSRLKPGDSISVPPSALTGK
jgi:LysM repeat protein